MCYDVQAKLDSMLKRAKRENKEDFVQELLRKIERFNNKPMFHLSGFEYPELLIYRDIEPFTPVASSWGLIPSWVKDEQERKKIINSTLNARGETIFDKPSFADSAKNKRCIVCIDGFFEHKHHKGKTFPHFIARKDGEPISLGGLWSEWKNPDSGEILSSFSIVTTKANPLMAVIHNNPKLDGPRMPLILSDAAVDQWLAPALNVEDWESIKSLIQPAPDDNLTAHTVARLRGKKSPGNTALITKEVRYMELLDDPPTLF